MNKPKKKILFIVPILSKGGAERVITHLLNHINRELFIPQLLLIYNAKHAYLTNVKEDVEVFQLNISQNYKYYFIPTIKAIHKLKPNIVFSGLSGINILLSPFIPFFKKRKWIARETNTISEHVTNKNMLFLYRNFYKKYTTIIAQCNDMKVDLVDNFNLSPKKVSIINNPLDTAFIDKKLALSSVVNLPDGKTNLLACGRLSHQKGFDLLIPAFANLKHKEKYHLTIIGGEETAEYTAFLHALVKQHKLQNHITFAGYQNNSYLWLKKADVFILSSRYEGFPNVVLEALYCGTPVLSNLCKGGITDIIEEGTNGFIFKYDNNFESQLTKTIETDFNTHQIITQTKSKFALANIIHQYEEVLNAD